MYQYPAPPAYVAFEYRSPLSPSPNYAYGPSTRFNLHTAAPSPRASPKMHAHARRSSHQEPSYSYTYASPRMPSYYAKSGYAMPVHYSTLPRTTDHVRTSYDYSSPRGRSAADSADDRSRSRSGGKYRPHRSQYFSSEDDCEYAHRTPPPPYEHFENYRTKDYQPVHEKVPAYTEAEPTVRRSRARRRASHAVKHERKGSYQKEEDVKAKAYASRKAQPSPSPERAASPKRATEEDARRANIPAGFSYRNWDPAEKPITLLGSVFDANSLGKWIYDWTVYYHGAATPLSEVAGELWLLLIQLAGKVKRAEACTSKLRRQEDRDTIEDFLESGDRLWIRFKKLLGLCEEYMMRVARKQSGATGEQRRKNNVVMGSSSGCAFVDSMFGRDRELEKTERLMTGMRLWSMRFDANCEEILRKQAV